MTETPTQTGAGAIVAWLEDLGCREVFLVPGAQIDPLTTALAGSKLKVVVAQHELGAAYMADAAARLGGRLGVCLMGGGPGLAYAVAAAVTARVDRQPLLFISGAPDVMDGLNFQDSGRDQAIMAAALDHSKVIGAPVQIDPALAWAAGKLRAISPTPVHLCLPLAVQRQAHVGQGRNVEPQSIAQELPREQLRDLLHKPRLGLLAGAGCVAEGVSELLLEAISRHRLALLTTYDAKGVVDETHPQCLGAVGYAASLRARLAMTELDGLFVLGATRGLREPDGAAVFETGAPALVQSYGESPEDDTVLRASCRDILRALVAAPGPSDDLAASRSAWLNELARTPSQFPIRAQSDTAALDVGQLVHALRAAAPRDAPLFCDAGLFRRFAGHYWTAYSPRTLFVASRTAPMGWAIAGCVGAAACDPRRPAFALTGDGCMRMLGTEIATAAQIGAPAKVVISDNGLLGNVYLRSRETAAESLSHSPPVDWVGFARALGAQGLSVSSLAELPDALEAAVAEPGPSIVRVVTAARPFGA